MHNQGHLLYLAGRRGFNLRTVAVDRWEDIVVGIYGNCLMSISQ